MAALGVSPANPQVAPDRNILFPRSSRVPGLHGMTLKHAKRALTGAHCQLGTVHRPAHHTHRLHVHHQSAPAGSRHHTGYHVNIRLR